MVPGVILIVFLGTFGLFTARLLVDFKLNHPNVHNMGKFPRYFCLNITHCLQGTLVPSFLVRSAERFCRLGQSYSLRRRRALSYCLGSKLYPRYLIMDFVQCSLCSYLLLSHSPSLCPAPSTVSVGWVCSVFVQSPLPGLLQ
jgi:hypothetical protein